MNRFIGIGRLVRDPEVRYTTGENQTAVARYTLAIDRRFKRDGEQTADFINCVAWRGTAETIAKYLKKGREIAVEGRLQTGSYDAQDGTKRYTTDVVIDNFTFIGGGNSDAPVDNQGGSSNIVESTDISEDPFKDFGEEVALSDDDLPF